MRTITTLAAAVLGLGSALLPGAAQAEPVTGTVAECDDGKTYEIARAWPNTTTTHASDGTHFIPISYAFQAWFNTDEGQEEVTDGVELYESPRGRSGEVLPGQVTCTFETVIVAEDGYFTASGTAVMAAVPPR